MSLRPDNFNPMYKLGHAFEASNSSNGDVDMSYNNSGSSNCRRDSSIDSAVDTDRIDCEGQPMTRE